MCHFASFAKKIKKKKKKVFSFILQREPSQRSMPNWHRTVVLSTLSCKNCTQTGLFNKLTGLSWFFKKKKNTRKQFVRVCVCLLTLWLCTCPPLQLCEKRGHPMQLLPGRTCYWHPFTSAGRPDVYERVSALYL